jgi:protein phosphatase
MIKLENLTQEAFESDCSEYLNIIQESHRLLTSENSQKSELIIEGRLVKLPASGEAVIVGDLHGDIQSLTKILKESKFLEKASKNNDIFLVFLGDYGDRGLYSTEVYYTVLKLKVVFPENVLLMRGNHEGPDDLLPYPHDLPQNLRRKFGKDGKVVYSKIREIFPSLYNIVVVNNRYVLIHGGAPSKAASIDDLRFAHLRHPKENFLEEMLWSDPIEEEQGIQSSPRGAGKLFGDSVTRNLLKMLNVKILIRGHESSQNGYKINHDGKIITLFSRKGSPYFNSSAAYLHLPLSIKPDKAHELKPYIQQF